MKKVECRNPLLPQIEKFYFRDMFFLFQNEQFLETRILIMRSGDNDAVYYPKSKKMKLQLQDLPEKIF